MDNLKYSEILQLNRTLSESVTGKPYKVYVLSNVTVNTFKPILEYVLRNNGINPEINIGNFDNIVQDSASAGDVNLVVIFYELLNIIDGVAGFFEALDDEKISQLQQKLCAEIDIIFQNLETVPVVVLNTFSAAASET